MSPTTGTWKDRSWAKRWMERRTTLERRQEAGEWINCDANCYCCRYLVDEGCVDTDDDANEDCPAPGPTPAAAPAPTAEATTIPSASETTAAQSSSSSDILPTTTPVVDSTVTRESTAGPSTSGASSSEPATSTSDSTASASASTASVSQEWVFPLATGSIRARQAVDAASFGPVYREDSMIVQWTPEDTTPGIQWFCESNSGSRSGGLVSSNQSQPLRIQFNSLAEQANDADDVFCRLGFTDAPGQTVQWQYINTPDTNGANVISAPASVATAAVATATSLLSSATNTIAASATSSANSSSGGGGGLSTGAAAGVGVGVGIVVIIAIILGVIFWRRRKNKGTHRTPVWASNDHKSQNSDDSAQPPYYSDQQNPGNGVYELPGGPVQPTELPAGIKGTTVMPSELHSYENRGVLAELGSDKDLEEQTFRPRPLAPRPAQFVEGGDDGNMLSPSENGTESSTMQSAVSPASGTLSSERSGYVSPLRKSSQNSPVSVDSQDAEQGWTSNRSRFHRKPVGRGE